MEIHAPHAPVHTFKDFLIALATITAGVLIALSIEGLLEWNHNRVLVREAKATIAREIAENKKELDDSLGSLAAFRKEVTNALNFADQMLRDRKSDINTLSLTLALPDLSTASWETAERTGALAHMDYAEVRNLSLLYGYQRLVAEHHRRAVDRLAAASASILGYDNPHQAPPKDLELFRHHVLSLRAELSIHEDLGRQLSRHYAEALTK